MPSRKNHGARVQARRDTALRNNERRLITNKLMSDEKRQRTEREIAILIERGAKS